MTENKKFLATALTAAKKAGFLLKKNLNRKLTISYKGRKNLVTEMDKKSERLIIRYIKDRYPSHTILSEESGLSDNAHSVYKWIIDPLDGTTNYAHGFNFFAVSIALMKKNQIVAGVVYDPVRNELFSAAKACGAYLNNKRIKVSRIKTLTEALLSTGFPYKLGKAMNRNIGYFISFMMKAQAVRRPGSASLDLCYVAAGRFDGFWEMELHPWDTAAGLLIVQEAGGKVTNFKGERFDPFMKQIMAANPKVHRQMLCILGKGD
jgi:myo-inositol-1(or 4)-monophosphatase